MNVIGFNRYGLIEIEIDGQHFTVPNVPENPHRQLIAEWEFNEEGERLNTIPPYVAPPAQPLPITRRQLRLTLVRNGISLATVETAIAAMPNGIEKEEAEIEWADASEFERSHPTLLLIASALGLTEAQVDAMWRQAEVA